jgi:hypothetical protein
MITWRALCFHNISFVKLFSIRFLDGVEIVFSSDQLKTRVVLNSGFGVELFVSRLIVLNILFHLFYFLQ